MKHSFLPRLNNYRLTRFDRMKNGNFIYLFIISILPFSKQFLSDIMAHLLIPEAFLKCIVRYGHYLVLWLWLYPVSYFLRIEKSCWKINLVNEMVEAEFGRCFGERLAPSQTLSKFFSAVWLSRSHDERHHCNPSKERAKLS